MPEFLARVDVAEVNLDEGHGDPQQRVSQRHAGMGQAAGIEQNPGDLVRLGGMNPGNQLVLGIALRGKQFMAAGLRQARELGFDPL